MAVKEKQEKKPNIFKRIGQKFKNLKSEFKKITWASPKSVFKSFLIVVVYVALIALAIGIADLVLTWLFEFMASTIPAFGVK
ncbi:MAG: preprotein translocase subunit SecE [Clostridia bacterium]|nr:preprotein translocase subunit SecE [Clostridia bacterium]